MQAFHISAPPSGSWRQTHVDVHTSIAPSGATKAMVSTEKSITNPLYVLTSGAAGPQDLHRTSKQSTVDGSGNAALDTAIKALEELGTRHGVVGISLSPDATSIGGVALATSPGAFVTNTADAKAIGDGPLRAIDSAARTVLELVAPAIT